MADFETAVGCALTTTYMDSAFSVEGFQVTPASLSNGVTKTLPAPTTEAWYNVNFNWNQGSTSMNGVWIQFYDTAFSTSQPIARMRASYDSGTSRYYDYLEIWNGSAWDIVYTFYGFITADAVAHWLSVRLKLADSGGVFEVWKDKIKIATFTGDTIRAGYSQIDKVFIGNPNGGATGAANWIAYSEIVITGGGESPLDYRVKAHQTVANGANTAWTGDEAAVDETGIGDTDFISSATAGEIETFTMGDLQSTINDPACRAFVASLRASLGTTGPQNIQAALRIGGVNYFSGDIAGYSQSVFKGSQAIFETSPATAAKWTVAEINGLEIGVRSAA